MKRSKKNISQRRPVPEIVEHKNSEDINDDNNDSAEIVDPSHIPPQLSDLLAHLPVVKSATKIREYSTEMRTVALALRSRGYTYRAIGQALNLGLATVYDWCNDPEENGLADLAEQVRRGLADRAYLQANMILSRVSDKDIDSANLQQKAVSFSIFVDKARLLGGESTQNLSVVTRRADSARAELAQTEQEMKALGASPD